MSIIEMIVEVVFNVVGCLRNWRFFVGASPGILLAFVAYDGIVNEPHRWIVAGTLGITGIIVGACWNDAHRRRPRW